MPLHDYLPLFLFVIVSTVTPGGATTLATASGAHFGFRRSLPYMAGIAAGLASMAAAAAAGLGGIMLAIPALQLGMKAIGSCYLVWLASRIGRSGAPRLDAHLRKPAGFASGVWMLWHNPKGWAMTLGAAASFAALAPGPLRLGVLLGCAFGVAAMASLSVWCAAGLLFARLLRTDLQWRLLNGMLALLLVISIIPMWLP
ncbi:LysE family translocator [Burkholderia ubonensis]|uniref:Amino acid transporter n=1 Tax=Burkholderia ubonensis subsp. mesacidophila TaxID=265293 RepID=A0A2A4F9K1_9BURK|nr:LysE family transporter [Burkholderia ubonensis]PCE30493.1 amino acid transporter [Burkholderia ubonensis subsp. mesacidophila]